ncbi:hypothetical protein SUDANB120_01828 [Streptomyces sp. enrichment culture]|uniref:Uncharacterized protein n=1 Tax=Streptomyces toxytricini TaxID=67369 RepID=A0ABW8EQA9_STRT5|nr:MULTISPECIES: hypothetical protein [Streptomyces]MBD3579368.1 hypothetical protein [Streptomyces sp. KD18]GGS93962.1 hypothetical protein GCM10010286_18450 [Streptomyces toxytricini]
MAWTWRFETADGSPAAPAVEPEEFTTQGDAESWIGEYWKELLEGGTERVRLSDDGGAEVYAMSLREALDA